jgi:hypothetical protein
MKSSPLVMRLQDFYDSFGHRAPGATSQDSIDEGKARRAFLRGTDFLSKEAYDELKAARKKGWLSRFLFRKGEGLGEGYYQVGALGRIEPPGSEGPLYLSSAAYLRFQLLQTLRFCVQALVPTEVDFSIVGFLLAIVFTVVLFALGLSLRLLWSLLATAVQFAYVRTGARRGRVARLRSHNDGAK